MAEIEYRVITVPDMNDSVSRIVINRVQYKIRFSFNDTKAYWKFSLYDSNEYPIILNVKIVPRFPLNVFYPVVEFPDGVFGVMTTLDRIGRSDFVNGKAKFVYAPLSEFAD